MNLIKFLVYKTESIPDAKEQTFLFIKRRQILFKIRSFVLSVVKRQKVTDLESTLFYRFAWRLIDMISMDLSILRGKMVILLLIYYYTKSKKSRLRSLLRNLKSTVKYTALINNIISLMCLFSIFQSMYGKNRNVSSIL